MVQIALRSRTSDSSSSMRLLLRRCYNDRIAGVILFLTLFVRMIRLQPFSGIGGANIEKRQFVTKETKTNTSAKRDPNITLIPNLLFAGAAKAGSTSVAQWLMYDSEGAVCYAGLLPNETEKNKKEVDFFNNKERYRLGIDFYRRHFEHCASTPFKYIMDATPATMRFPERVHSAYSQDIADHDLNKSLKVLMSLREPVGRELSWYNMMVKATLNKPWDDPWFASQVVNPNRRNGSMFFSFDEYVDKKLIPYLKRKKGVGAKSYYYKHLRKWFQLFDRKSILLVSYDEMLQNQTATEWRLKEFLGLQDDMDGKEIPKVNTASAGQLQYSSCATQAKLSKYFIPMNNELYELLEEHRGPAFEQYPFPKFRLSQCVDENGKIVDNYTATIH